MHTLCVFFRGRYSGEDYHDRTCMLTDSCRHVLYVQDESHVIFQCCHPASCALQVHFECLFDVCASTSEHTEKLHLFVNQPDDIEVAKFVRQLQIIVEHFMHLHMINCFFVQLLFGVRINSIFRP